jgi:hypothetical protein
MADKKITQLNPLVVADSGDLLPIVDLSGPETKRITFGQMFASPGPIGASNPDTAVFADITLAAGATISEFTTDPTLAGNSNYNVPTEKAVRSYVESKLHGVIFDATDSKSIVYIDTTGGLDVDKLNFTWNDSLKGMFVKGNISLGDDALTLESLSKTVGLSINKNLVEPSISSYIGVGNTVQVDSTADIIAQFTSVNKTLSSSNLTGSLVNVTNNSYINSGNLLGSKVEVVDYNGTPSSIIGQEISITSNPAYISSDLTALKVTGFLGASTVTNVFGIDVDMSCGLALPATVISGDSYGLRLRSVPPSFVTGTSYGLYIGNDSITNTAPDWSIFVADSTSQVKFEGSLESRTLTLSTGATVDEISTDITLAGDSDLAVPTEHAVKTYVDNAIGSISISVDKIYKGLTSAQVYDNTSFSGLVIKTRDLILGDATGTNVTTFYFNGYSSSNWTNPQNMLNGNLISYAQAGLSAGTYTQINNNNTTSDSTAVGSIIKVEIAIYATIGVGNVEEAYLYPLFGGSNEGTPISFITVGGWSSWSDITHDPQAPLDWTWQDLYNLGSKVKVKIGLPGGGPYDEAKVRQINLRVTYANQTLVTGSKEVANFNNTGLILEYGVRINKFSSDGTLVGNSDSSIPTERAIRTYIDNIVQHLDLMRVRTVTQDSTAVSGEAILVDGTGDVVIHIIPKSDGKYVIKNLTTHKVTMIPTFGTIDYESLYINHTLLKSVTIISNGANLFIV